MMRRTRSERKSVSGQTKRELSDGERRDGESARDKRAMTEEKPRPHKIR